MAILNPTHSPWRILSTSKFPAESQWLFIIHLAARFWTVSSKAQSFTVWGFHTTQAYSRPGLMMLLYATSFASAEHPNIVHRNYYGPECHGHLCQNSTFQVFSFFSYLQITMVAILQKTWLFVNNCKNCSVSLQFTVYK